MTHKSRLSTLYNTAVFAAAILLHIPVLQAQPVQNGIPSLDDLLQAEQFVSQCLGMNLSADSNQASLSGNRMGVAFQPHESGPDLQRLFVGIFNRPDIGEDWALQTLRLHATQTLDDGSGVHVTGLLDAATTELLYQSVADLWAAALGADFTITTINTTRMPETWCDFAGNRTEVDGVWHEVLVAAQKLPDAPILPRYLYAVGLVDVSREIDRARAGNYKFNFRENADGYPEFVSVDCATVPEPCGENLDTLRTALGTNGEEDSSQRDAAILAVLPPAYTKEHIDEMQVSTGNGRENLVIELEDVAVSAARTVRGIVICRRPLGSGADWDCEYRFINYNQTLANGMTVSVRSLDVSEAQVETLVAAVANDIVNARIVSISADDTGFTLSAAGIFMPGLTARFDSNLKLTEKEFRDR